MLGVPNHEAIFNIVKYEIANCEQIKLFPATSHSKINWKLDN